MTVETTTRKVTANGNDVATSFSFSPIVIFESTDIVVTKTSSAGVETVLSEGSSSTTYSVTVASYPGTGSITYPASGGTPLATGETITIKRVLPLLQETDLNNQGGYFADVQEAQFDRLLMIDLQQQEELDRTIKMPVSYTGSVEAETDAPTAGYYLRVNAGGTALEWVNLSSSVSLSDASPGAVSLSAAAAGVSADVSRADHVHLLPTVSVAKGGTGATSAADARTNLGLVIGTDVLAPSGSGASLTGLLKQGTFSIFAPAGAMRPTVSNGCAALTDVETTAGRPDMQVLDFDASADEAAQFQIAMPKNWDEGTITFRAYWTSTATDTDGVAWALQGVACSDGDTIDAAYGTEVVVTDLNQSTAEDLYVTATSSAVTIAGTPAAGDMCFFRVFRDVSDAADTATEDARLIGIEIFFTINAADES